MSEISEQTLIAEVEQRLINLITAGDRVTFAGATAASVAVTTLSAAVSPDKDSAGSSTDSVLLLAWTCLS